MIYHIVLFKIDKSVTEEKINALKVAINDLKTKIPGIIDFKWGSDISIENLNKGFTHGFIMSFDNKESRDAYVPHPLHKQVIEKYVNQICEDGLVFDVEA